MYARLEALSAAHRRSRAVDGGVSDANGPQRQQSNRRRLKAAAHLRCCNNMISADGAPPSDPTVITKRVEKMTSWCTRARAMQPTACFLALATA